MVGYLQLRRVRRALPLARNASAIEDRAASSLVVRGATEIDTKQRQLLGNVRGERSLHKCLKRCSEPPPMCLQI